MSQTVVQAFRFCHKCQSLFYEGKYEAAGTPKGLCPAGGSHEAMGYQFEIPSTGSLVNRTGRLAVLRNVLGHVL